MSRTLSILILIAAIFCSCTKESSPSIYGDWRLAERTTLDVNGQYKWEKNLESSHYELIRFSNPDQFFLIQDISPYTYQAKFKTHRQSIYIEHSSGSGYDNDTLEIKSMTDDLLWLGDRFGFDYKYIRGED